MVKGAVNGNSVVKFLNYFAETENSSIFAIHF